MPWFAVDDEFHGHPKRLDLLHAAGGVEGNAAFGMWTALGSWCADNLTDGFVPAAMVDYLSGMTPEDTARLVEHLEVVSMLVATEDRGRPGVQLVDYLDRNPSAEDVRRARRVKADRQKKWRDKKAAEKAAVDGVDRLHDASPRTSRSTSRNAAPSPPLPSQEEEGGLLGGTGKTADDVDALHDASTDPEAVDAARATARAVATNLRQRAT